jgi:serine/threonine-protein kinase
MTPAKTDDLQPGTAIGRYTITRKIGSGGMGAVYEGTHSGLKKRVAIKVLHPSTAQAADVRTRFLREGEAASRIRYPHVVDIYDVGSEEGLLYLVMEYLEGEDLAALIKRQPVMDVQEISDIMLAALAAVTVAHEEGIIHRDLKPANIFLARGRKREIIPKVLDFGISKILDDHAADLTSSGALLGTPYYMSPEQAQGARVVTAASDQYSLGVILYQCVTGQKPFVADSMYRLLHSIVQGKFDPPRKHRPDVPEGFEAIILKAMANSPAERYASVRALGSDLVPFASERSRALWEPFFAAEKHVDTLPGADSPPPTRPAPIPTPLPLQYTAQDRPGGNGRDRATIARGPASAPYAEPLSASYSSTKNLSLGEVAPLGKTGRAVLIGCGLGLIAALSVTFFLVSRSGVEKAPIVLAPRDQAEQPAESTRTTPATFTAVVSVQPKGATLELDGLRIESPGHLERQFARDGVTHTLLVTKNGFEPKTITFRDEPPPSSVELVALHTEPRPPPTKATPVVARPPKRPAPKPQEHHESKKSSAVGANQAPILR